MLTCFSSPFSSFSPDKVSGSRSLRNSNPPKLVTVFERPCRPGLFDVLSPFGLAKLSNSSARSEGAKGRDEEDPTLERGEAEGGEVESGRYGADMTTGGAYTASRSHGRMTDVPAVLLALSLIWLPLMRWMLVSSSDGQISALVLH